MVDPGEHHIAHKGEDRRIRVQGTETSEGQPFQVEVKLEEVELGGNDYAHQHSNDTPDDGRQHEHADGVIVVFD